jgi:enoyl-[acyl-carrier-protein] reductase (NADH)
LWITRGLSGSHNKTRQPGIVGDTDLAKNIPQEVLDLYKARELVKAPLVSNDVASTVGFLMSDLGRGYTGAVFELNNGCHR